MKPLIKYRGGKSNEIPNIWKHIPRYKGRYIEPFFGGGALYFHLEPKRAIINDINAKLMAFYRGVKNDFSNLREELEEIEKAYEVNRRQFDSLKLLTPNERVEDKNEELYYQLRDMFNDLSEKKYSDSLLYFFINKTAYSGMIRYNSKGEFNVPFGRYERLNTSLVTKKHSDLLINAEIHNTDYKNIFDMAEPDDFMFLDPPYDCVFSDYGNEEYKGGFDNECHVALAKDFKNLSCKALLVIGRTSLTERLYGDMIIDEYAKTYSVNIRNRFKSAATHILIANYETNYKTLFAEQNYTLAWQE
jgi:DNA adenine methylase (dam)